MSDTQVKGLFLCGRKITVGIHQVAWLEGDTSRRHVFLAYEIGSTAHIAHIVPCCIQAPSDAEFLSRIIPVERNRRSSRYRLQIHSCMCRTLVFTLGISISRPCGESHHP